MAAKEKATQKNLEKKSAIREKLSNIRNNISDALSFDGDTDCECEEEWDNLVYRVDGLEATLRALMLTLKALEKKVGEMGAKADVLEKSVGEMKGAK